jgi:hypothetical protein
MSYNNPHLHSCPWHDFTEIVGPPNIKWCEGTLCGWITEPANTWSNIAYIIAAIAIYHFMKKEKYKDLHFLAPTMLMMGLFSLFFHLSNNYFSQMLDFVGMFFFLNWLGVLSFKRGGILSHTTLVRGYLSLCSMQILLVHLFYGAHLKFQNLVVVSIAMVLVTEIYLFIKKKRAHPYFYIGLFVVGLAQLCSLLDSKRIFCDPGNHWFQLHAAQHVLSAIGLTIASLHYREKFKEIKFSRE